MTMFDDASTQAIILRTLADAQIPPGHTVAIVGGATRINGRVAASVVVAIRAGDHWTLAFDAEHTAGGDDVAAFGVKASW